AAGRRSDRAGDPGAARRKAASRGPGDRAPHGAAGPHQRARGRRAIHRRRRLLPLPPRRMAGKVTRQVTASLPPRSREDREGLVGLVRSHLGGWPRQETKKDFALFAAWRWKLKPQSSVTTSRGWRGYSRRRGER